MRRVVDITKGVPNSCQRNTEELRYSKCYGREELVGSRWYKVDAVTAKDLTIAACKPSACAAMSEVGCSFVDIGTRGDGGDVVHS